MNFNFTPTLPEFRTLARSGNLIPVFTEFIADDQSPIGAFAKLDDGGYTFLFESVEKSEQTGRYSILIVAPRTVLESQGRTVRITTSSRLYAPARNVSMARRSAADSGLTLDRRSTKSR